MTAVSIRLPDDVADRLDRLVALTGRTQTSFITEAVLEHLDDLEDLYAAEQRLGEIRAGQTRPIPIEEVMKRYGMED